MKPNNKLVKKILQIFCLFLIQSCGPKDPTVFSGEAVDKTTGREIPGITVLVSVYEKAPFLTLPGIIRLDTIETDSMGKFRLVVPYNEEHSRFNINVLEEVTAGTFEYINGERDCSPYDCNSFIPGNVYKFKLKIPLD